MTCPCWLELSCIMRKNLWNSALPCHGSIAFLQSEKLTDRLVNSPSQVKIKRYACTLQATKCRVTIQFQLTSSLFLSHTFTKKFQLTLIPCPSSTSLSPSVAPDSTRLQMHSWACLLMTGPRSAPGSVPAVARNFDTLLFNPSYQDFESLTNTAVVIAMHPCPAAPNAAPTSAFSVASGCASGITTA